MSHAHVNVALSIEGQIQCSSAGLDEKKCFLPRNQVKFLTVYVYFMYRKNSKISLKIPKLPPNLMYQINSDRFRVFIFLSRLN